MRKSSDRAFSLTEVIIVVAIIVILIAILLPSVSGAREQAKFVACSANLRSIGQLIQIYSEQNDGRVPRGPSHDVVDVLGSNSDRYELMDKTVATSQLWMGFDFIDKSGIRRPAQYVGLGMLTREAGRSGNEYLFCPGDDFDRFTEDAPVIGQLGRDALGSYLFRQTDMLPQEILFEGKLDDMRETDCTRLQDTSTGLPLRYNLNVEALALDHNNLGTGEFEASNHRGRWVNLVYRDGSVGSFDNDLQKTLTGKMVPWGTLSAEAYRTFPGDNGLHIMGEFDRIFVAADYSRSDKPWKAPLPFLPLSSAIGSGG